MAEQSKPIFLDTAYVNALINTRDQWHERAVWWERKLAAERRRLLTTQFILIEIGDGLATVKYRAEAGAIINHLTSSSFVEIIPATSQLFTDGFNLYSNVRIKRGASPTARRSWSCKTINSQKRSPLTMISFRPAFMRCCS
ncbi:MAG: type II toxin-antitoxin system VapC family toxin, partial [Pyrinomonadaceae bacterium]